MKKEDYQQLVEMVKKNQKELERILKEAKEKYIKHSTDLNETDYVEITFQSGLKVKGQIATFGILHDGNVYVTCYKDGSKNKYISSPYKEIRLIKKMNING